MTDARDPDNIPNGAGEGDTSSSAPDTTSGGKPEEPSAPPRTEEPDGTPVDNPSGG
jgi:hypothetical protein